MAKIFGNANGVEGTVLRRGRQPEALLRELYHEEINPRFRVPELRGLKTMILVSLLSIILFVALMAYKFNSFIGLREDVYAAKGNLEASIQRRANLFDNVIKLTLSHAELEHSVFSHTSEMRTEIAKHPELADKLPKELLEQLKAGAPQLPGLAKSLEGVLAGGDMEASLGRLLAVVEQYPNIRSSETYQQAMTSLVEMEDRIAERRMDFHTAMRSYNTAIANFPWHMLAQMTNFQRFDYYEAENAQTGKLNLDPQLYQQLMPLKFGKGGGQ